MRWIAIVMLFLAMAGPLRAAGTDEQYLDIYNEILQGDSLMDGGHSPEAAARYLQAQTDLQKLQKDHPSWNPDIVKFRLEYIADKLQALEKFVPKTAPTPAPGVQGPAATAGVSETETTIAALRQQNAGYQEEIRSLKTANVELQGKLKEALSVQPAAVSPEELAKAQARIMALQKERDLLTVALQQEKDSNAAALAQARAAAAAQVEAEIKARAEADQKKSQAELAEAQQATATAERKLAEATKELDDLKAAQVQQAAQQAEFKAKMLADQKAAQDEMDRLKEAGVESQKIIDAANKELELLRGVHPPEVAATEGGKQIPETGDQIKQLLAQVAGDEAEIARLKADIIDSDKKLAAANEKLEHLNATPPAAASTDATKSLTEERDKLKEELAERSKDLADAETHHSQEIIDLRAALHKAEQERDKLAAQTGGAAVTNVPPTAESTNAAAVAHQVEQLQARIAVLEAAPVPYTAEELALLKLPPPTKPAEIPKITPVKPKHVYSSKDLPPGSGALWSDALHASMGGDYATAIEKFNEVLHQDPNNVYVMAFLGNAQFAAGRLEDCEKTVLHALSVDSEDPGSLYLLGLLRYRQDRLDEALDALSLSARYNPTNAATENFLGCVLADKGFRPAAETALRKALQADPDYADAHFNLAVVYAGNDPPSLELARWHYKKALALGHDKNPKLESLLAEKPESSLPTKSNP